MTHQPEQKKKRNKTITKIVMTLSMGLLLLYITQGLGIEMQTIPNIETRLAPDRSQAPILAEYKVVETSGFERLWTISNAFVTQNRYGNGLIATL